MKKNAMRPSEALRRTYQKFGASFPENIAGLTLTQVSILRPLLASGPLSQTRLVEMTGIDRSTLSEALRRMATAKLVVAVREEGNLRTVMVSLTPAGRAALLKADGVVSKAEASFMRLVPPPDRDAFLRCLRAVAVSQ